MHSVDLDISLSELTKVEGAAALDVKVRGGKVEYAHFKITEEKRFFTAAMTGKPIVAIPQLLSRICGTCSNAHIMCAIKACEHALGIPQSLQTMLLRDLTMDGLMIRDHALHLYLFVMPDLFGKDSFLEFDENDLIQHEILHDAFDIKGAGNFLATLVAGRSVHAPYPTIGGFMKFPDEKGIAQAVEKLEHIRPAVLRLIDIFKKSDLAFDRKTNYIALVPEKRYGYLDGCIQTGKGICIPQDGYRDHLERVVLPYSQASAYKHEGECYMIGSLARLNLSRHLMHPATQASAKEALAMFPSTNIYRNNLAQALEILNSVDTALETLKTVAFRLEPVIKAPNRESVGIGVIEAPRGTLYHKVVLGADGLVKEGEVVVPTGQNQINIEEDIATLVESLLQTDTPQEQIVPEMEKLIRAYDPCMSCASHFLKVKWV